MPLPTTAKNVKSRFSAKVVLAGRLCYYFYSMKFLPVVLALCVMVGMASAESLDDQEKLQTIQNQIKESREKLKLTN